MSAGNPVEWDGAARRQVTPDYRPLVILCTTNVALF